MKEYKENGEIAYFRYPRKGQYVCMKIVDLEPMDMAFAIKNEEGEFDWYVGNSKTNSEELVDGILREYLVHPETGRELLKLEHEGKFCYLLLPEDKDVNPFCALITYKQ